jgi:hypothetical protein
VRFFTSGFFHQMNPPSLLICDLHKAFSNLLVNTNSPRYETITVLPSSGLLRGTEFFVVNTREVSDMANF